MIPTESPGFICNRRVGFLFPRVCGRVSPAGCPHCNGGQMTEGDPFDDWDRDDYPYFGDYSPGYWGSDDMMPDQGVPPRSDFTEADAEPLMDSNSAFENDFGGS